MEQLTPIEPTTKRERELRDRAVRDYEALKAVGLDTSRTFYAPGTEATAAKTSGRIAQKRRDYLALALATDALDKLTDTVLAEDRQDLTVKVGGFTSDAPDEPHLTVGITGGWDIGACSKPSYDLRLAPTEQAYTQLMAKRPPSAPVPPQDVTSWLWKAPKTDAVVRHRKLPVTKSDWYSDEARECYALVGPGYKPYDLDKAAQDLKAAVPHDARARVRYDGARATVDVILQNPYHFDGGDAAGVGETHRVVLRMRTADDGSGGYHLSLLAERVRCINLTLLHAKKSLFHGTHRSENLGELVSAALDQIQPTMEAFAETWRATWQDYWVDKYTKGRLSGEEAVRRIVGHGKYRIPGLGADGTLDACLAALATEPGDTRAHVHNALTAAAHAAPVSWATRWADVDAEEQASQLLYQQVRWLPELDTQEAS